MTMTNEQGQAWRERAELAEQENARLHAVVQGLRDSIQLVRDTSEFLIGADMPMDSIREAHRESIAALAASKSPA